MISEHGRDHGHEPNQNPDGTLAGHVREFKHSMHRLGADVGLYAPNISKRLGGRGTSLRASMYLQEEVYKRGFRGQQWILAWTDGPNPMIEEATDRAVEEFVEPLMSAETTTAFAQTEPEAGSDATSMRTTARRANGDWIVTGHKHLITNAPFAEVVQVVARAEDGGFGVFLIREDTPGFSRGPIQQTMLDDGQTGSLTFEDCRIPRDMVLGEPRKDFSMPMRWINWTKARGAGMCVGLASLPGASAGVQKGTRGLRQTHRLSRTGGPADQRSLPKNVGDTGGVRPPPRRDRRKSLGGASRRRDTGQLRGDQTHNRGMFVRGLRRGHTGLRGPRVAQVHGPRAHIPGGTAEMQRRELARSLGLLKG